MIKSKFLFDAKSFASPNIEIFHENLSLLIFFLFSPIALIYDSLSLCACVCLCVCVCVCAHALALTFVLYALNIENMYI